MEQAESIVTVQRETCLSAWRNYQPAFVLSPNGSVPLSFNVLPGLDGA